MIERLAIQIKDSKLARALVCSLFVIFAVFMAVQRRGGAHHMARRK